MACPGREFRSIPDNTVSYPVSSSTDVGPDGSGSYFDIGQGTDYDLPPFEDGDGKVAIRAASAGVTAPCTGHGMCRTMREAGMSFNGMSLVNPHVYYDQWDADKMQGCLCDRGWEGYDCSYRSCPKGRDPYDENRVYNKDESYMIKCTADEGYFALEVFGEITIPIKWDAGPEYLRRALRNLKSTTGDVFVYMQENNNGLATVCDGTAPVKTRFKFVNMPGKLAPIRIVKNLGTSRFATTALSLGGNNPVIAMVSEYSLACPVCTTCFGNIHFTYGDSVSDAVDVTTAGAASAINTVLAALTDLTDANWPDLSIQTSMNSANDKICEGTENYVEITLSSTFGNIAGLGLVDGVYKDNEAYVTKGFSNYGMNLTWTSPSGNGTLYECSNQGVCDRVQGTCMCDSKSIMGVEAFRAGSGNGGHNQGTNGDCSFIEIAEGYGCAYSMNSSHPVNICGGHGTCDIANNVCMCDDGWGGAECEHYTCPKEYPFYAEPVSRTKARTEKVECSGQGLCDRKRGLCRCRAGFTGPSCNIFDCPRDAATGEECSGQGYCESMYDTYALHGLSYGKAMGTDPQRPQTWDATRIKNCLCYGKRSDGHYAHPKRAASAPKDGVGRWHTGGRPLSGFGGWECHNRMCPRGHKKMEVNDNMLMAYDQSSWPAPRKEIIRVVCTLDISTDAAVSFTLNHYGHETAPIYPGYSVERIKTAIEANPTIGNVTVTMDVTASGNQVGTKACDSSGTYTTGTGFTVRFDTESGNHDLPTVTVSDTSKNSDLSLSSVQDGNGDNAECGGDKLGYCDYGTGLCHCKPGRGSSDQGWAVGDTGDCGYRIAGSG
jgi:hypothetical protein